MSAEDQVKEFINAAALETKPNDIKLNLASAEEIVLKQNNGKLLQSPLVDEITNFHINRSPTVKKWVLSFMVKAAKQEPKLIFSMFSILKLMVYDDNSTVVKQVFTTINNLLRPAFRLLASQRSKAKKNRSLLTDIEDITQNIVETILCSSPVFVDHTSIGDHYIKVPGAIKIFETLIFCFTRRPERKTSAFKYGSQPNMWTLSDITSSHPLLSARALEAKGKGIWSTLKVYARLLFSPPNFSTNGATPTPEVAPLKIMKPLYIQLVNTLTTLSTHRYHYRQMTLDCFGLLCNQVASYLIVEVENSKGLKAIDMTLQTSMKKFLKVNELKQWNSIFEKTLNCLTSSSDNRHVSKLPSVNEIANAGNGRPNNNNNNNNNNNSSSSSSVSTPSRKRTRTDDGVISNKRSKIMENYSSLDKAEIEKLRIMKETLSKINLSTMISLISDNMAHLPISRPLAPAGQSTPPFRPGIHVLQQLNDTLVYELNLPAEISTLSKYKNKPEEADGGSEKKTQVRRKVWKLPQHTSLSVSDTQRTVMIRCSFDRIVQSLPKMKSNVNTDHWGRLLSKYAVQLDVNDECLDKLEFIEGDENEVKVLPLYTSILLGYIDSHGLECKDLAIALLYEIYCIQSQRQSSETTPYQSEWATRYYGVILYKMVKNLIVKLDSGSTPENTSLLVSIFLEAPLLTRNVHNMLLDRLKSPRSVSPATEVLLELSLVTPSPWMTPSLQAMLEASCDEDSYVRRVVTSALLGEKDLYLHENTIKICRGNIQKILEMKFESTVDEDDVVMDAAKVMDDCKRLLHLPLALVLYYNDIIGELLDVYSHVSGPVQEYLLYESKSLFKYRRTLEISTSTLTNDTNAAAVGTGDSNVLPLNQQVKAIESIRDNVKTASEVLAIRILSQIIDQFYVSHAINTAGDNNNIHNKSDGGITRFIIPEPVVSLTKEILKKTDNYGFVIPILTSLPSSEILNSKFLLKLLKVDAKSVSTALSILLSPKPREKPEINEEEVSSCKTTIIDEDEPVECNISPPELFVQLNKLPALKVVMTALSLCLTKHHLIYNQTTMGIILSLLTKEKNLPNWTFWTMIECVKLFPAMKGRVIEILGDLVTKQIWTVTASTSTGGAKKASKKSNVNLWNGFKMCIEKMQPECYPVLLRIPPAQLNEILELRRDMLVPFSEFVTSCVSKSSQGIAAPKVPKSILSVVQKAIVKSGNMEVEE